ncbi:MAG TPA: hypothetical protein VF158_17650 [Longimicrobiales bacterium]
MRYDTWYESRSGRARRRAVRRPPHGRTTYRREAWPGPPLPRPDRRHPFPIEGRGYRGPGELRRYGRAPVPYGPEHTYDYHLGDRYGYGPDFVAGEERIRQRPLPRLRRRDRRR